MADNEKEIIEKIEAEVKNEKPAVLNSKRSAFINNKARLGGGGCGLSNCGVIVVGYPTGTTAVADQGIFSYDHDNNTYVRIPGPIGNRSDIARWDNKVYLTRPTTIEEWELDYANCTSSLVRIIQISGIPGINIGVGMDMKDANTIIAATSSISGGTNSVLEIDISSQSNPATVSVLFTTGYSAAGDVVYMQDTGQILISHSNSDLVLYDYNGTVIDSYPHYGGTGMYRDTNGDVFISGYPINSSVQQVTFNPLIIGSTLQNSGLVISGAAYNSNPKVVCDPPSTNCYDIGDIGPEGGIIFAVPLGHPQNNGVNQTNFYYEVAKNDIAIGGTPSAGFNLTCGEQTNPFSAGMKVGPFSGGSAQGWGTVSLSTASALNVGDEIDWLYLPPGTTIIAIVLGSSSGILYFSNPFHWAALPVSPSGAGSPFLPPYYTGFGYYNTVGNWIPNQVNTSGNSTDYPFPTFTPQSNVSSGWTATGAEWGVYNKPNIVTSLDFGTGHKNTDVIDAYPLSPGTPTGGIHPWLNSHDIAATLCKQQPTQSGLDDWFLPSVQEFKEMFTSVGPGSSVANQITFNPSTQNSENYYWTSSHRLPPGTIISDPDKYAWAYNTNTNNLELAYRCHALSVRHIRRFECKVEPPLIEKGITYDYRIDTFGDNCAGTIHEVVNPGISQYTSVTHLVNAYAFSMLNQSTSGGGNIIFNTSDFVLAIDSTTIPGGANSLPNIGDSLNTVGGVTYPLLGPIVDVIDIATHPQLGVSLPTYQSTAGANIDTLLVFNQSNMTYFQGPNGPWIGQNYPFLTFVDGISYSTQTLNPLWSAPVFGSSFEIGHPRLNIGNFNRLDVRMNDVVGLGHNDRIVQRIGEIFNIKIYNQYEELLGDWDYKLTGESDGFGCCVSHCYKGLVMVRSQTNYVNPLYSSHPDVVDLKVYHEGLGVGGHPDGWAYFAITCVTDPTFNSNFTRGNTLNLENWRGTGQNNRTKDTTYPISGMQWKWQRETCGVNLSGHCCGGTCGRYHAEVNPPLNNIYCNAFNGWTPNHTALFDNKNHCQSGQLDVVGGSVSKLIGPSENYPSEINECFERGIEEVDVHVIPQVSGENTSKRQKFIDDKKPKETGPFGIAGYYPLYDTIEAATYNSPTPIESRTGEDTYGYHIHEFEGTEYYMPNGLKIGVTQFHGDYNGQIIPQTIVEPEVMETPEIIETPEIFVTTPPPIITEPEEEPEQTYTPPTTPRPRGSGGGGGY